MPFLPKRIGEWHNLLVVRLSRTSRKPRVMAVLLPAFGVPAGDLDVAVCKRAIPDIDPRRGIANALTRFTTSGSESVDPVVRLYVNFVSCFLPAYPWASVRNIF